MKNVKKEDLPESAVLLGTDWQNNRAFPPALDRQIIETEGDGWEIWVVTNYHYYFDGSFEQWSKDYYAVDTASLTAL